MARKILTYLAPILLAVGTAVSATRATAAGGSESEDCGLGASGADIGATIKNLSRQVDLWHDAVLKGDANRVELFEEWIVNAVRSDIQETEKAVRHHAKKAILINPQTGKEAEELSSGGSENDKQSFRRSLSLLNCKEQLSRSFCKTNAFSNKYRLINDYIDLLRKQLDMPKVKLADQKVRSPRYPGGQATE